MFDEDEYFDREPEPLLIQALGIHHKRVCAILRKWEDRRWWNGSSSGLTGNFGPGAPEVLSP